jgi:nitrogen fixation/metabolism regulation signal transduction histidine kinase
VVESDRAVLAARVRTQSGDTIRVTAPLPPALVARAKEITESVQLLEMLHRDRGPVLRGLLATFLVVYGGILALVVLLGLLVASRLTRPLRALGEGIDRVAGGDLSTRVSVEHGGHLGRLLGRFNQMVERLDRQREELVRLEKLAAWRNIARRLAHEIKNPLTPIQLAAQQMRDAYPGDDPEYRRMLDDGAGIVEDEVRSLRALVREFSEFARLPQPQPRETAVRDLLDDLVALYGAEKIAVTPALEEGLTAWCDPDEVHRVLINLVGNALHAQGEAGRGEPIEVGAHRGPAAFVSIEVRDRGPGVKPGDRSRVFAPDYSTKTQGMGLGLAIVEEIVRAHGGEIRIDDQARKKRCSASRFRRCRRRGGEAV